VLSPLPCWGGCPAGGVQAAGDRPGGGDRGGSPCRAGEPRPGAARSRGDSEADAADAPESAKKSPALLFHVGAKEVFYRCPAPFPGGQVVYDCLVTHLVETGKILEHGFGGFSFPWRQTTFEELAASRIAWNLFPGTAVLGQARIGRRHHHRSIPEYAPLFLRHEVRRPMRRTKAGVYASFTSVAHHSRALDF
jgi:hypothetical protein